MVLTVSFEDFPEAARRIVSAKEVYVSAHGTGSFISAADTHHDVLVVSVCALPRTDAWKKLEQDGFHVFEGAWTEKETGGNGITAAEAFVAAVAYASREATPGLWMDAFPTPPTPQIVLRAMYDEFCLNDEIGNVSYEEFIKYAHPNVVILGPGEILTYLQQKEEC